MDTLKIIGDQDTAITYTDRPTVKVIITHNDKLLILNDGLLPGGGVDEAESDHDAISRELQEELGVKVRDISPIGTVIQYRNFLSKKYIVKGYAASFDSISKSTNPQDEGEALFTKQWMSLEDARKVVSRSIAEAKSKSMDDDSTQGKLYNLMTTYELLNKVK